MAWHFCSARGGFDARATEWDRLNARLCDHVLLDSRFVAPLVRHFATDRTLLAASTDPSAVGMLLLEEARPGVWSTFQPSQAPLGLALLPPGPRLLLALDDLIRALPGWAVSLSILQQDPQCSPLQSLPREWRVAQVPYITTGRITLAGTFEDYWRRRSGDLRSDVAGRRRRLERRQMRCGFVVDQDGRNARRWLAEYGRLEESGWKGRAGTAVTADNTQGRFYAETLERCTRDARCFRLTFDDHTVAAQLAVHRDGTMVFLKTAYDEAFREFAPGLLLTHDIIRFLFAEGRARRFEIYGRADEGWTTKWIEETREMYHVELFRNWVVAAAARGLRAARLCGCVDDRPGGTPSPSA
jgi:hypothetical protein